MILTLMTSTILQWAVLDYETRHALPDR